MSSRLVGLLAAGVLVGLAGSAMLAAEKGPTTSPAPAGKGQWVNVSEPTTRKLLAEGKKICSSGAGVTDLEAGGTGGVMVDRTTGDVYMVMLANGLWKSKDQGATFERVDGGKIAYTPKGGEGYQFGFDADPNGKRFMCFMVHGTAAMVLDSGAKIVQSPLNSVDCGATDWSDGKTMIAEYHESGGKAAISLDGGATWKEIGKGFDSVGVFDAKTFVITKAKEPGILRSQDGGATWVKVSDLTPAEGSAMRVFKGVGYFTSKAGLLASKDRGVTWAVQGKPIDCSNGPLFGKDEKHLVVAVKEGLMETTDGGETWKLAAPIPDLEWSHSFMGHQYKHNFRNPAANCYAWDPQGDIFYVCLYTSPLLKYQR